MESNKMATMPIKKLVLNMSLPMMLSLLIQSLYNIVDSIFVARYSIDALTATSLSYPIQMLMISVGVGSAVGLNAVLSKALGSSKEKEASIIATTGVLISVFCGLLFGITGLLFSKTIAFMLTNNTTVAAMSDQYLFICMVFSIGNMVTMTLQRLMQSSGKALLSMVILVSGAVTNILLDPILIFGLGVAPEMGIAGAAIATVIGQWVSMLVGIILQVKYNKEIKINFKNFKLDITYIKSIYKVGLPTIITQVMQSLMVTCFNMILQPFSLIAVAFFGIYYKLQTFLFMPMNGLGQAAIPIVGFNYGSKNYKRIIETLKLIYPSGMIIALIGSILFFVFPKELLCLFTNDTSILEIGITGIRIIAPSFIFASVTLLSGYFASGLQDGITNMTGAFLRLFIPLIPVSYLLGRYFGLDAVWYGFMMSEVIACIYSVLKIRHLFHLLHIQ